MIKTWYYLSTYTFSKYCVGTSDSVQLEMFQKSLDHAEGQNMI